MNNKITVADVGLMQARMEVIRGAKTKEIRLRLPSVIGRGGDSKIKLPASTVSRHHCELYEYEEQIVVRDLGSSNGTVVNGHKIKGPTFLTPEDVLTIGPVSVHVCELREELPSTTTAYPVAQSHESAPSFDELPVEESKPVAAAGCEYSSAVEEHLTEVQDDDSVLQYTEPKSTGRSFLGIAPAEDAVEPVTELPIFDGLEKAAKQELATDDSALKNFFKNLEND